VFFQKLCSISEHKCEQDSRSTFRNVIVLQCFKLALETVLDSSQGPILLFPSLHTLALQSCQLQTHQYHGYGMVIVGRIHSYLHQKSLHSHYLRYTQVVALCIDLIKEQNIGWMHFFPKRDFKWHPSYAFLRSSSLYIYFIVTRNSSIIPCLLQMKKYPILLYILMSSLGWLRKISDRTAVICRKLLLPVIFFYINLWLIVFFFIFIKRL